MQCASAQVACHGGGEMAALDTGCTLSTPDLGRSREWEVMGLRANQGILKGFFYLVLEKFWGLLDLLRVFKFVFYCVAIWAF